MGCGNMLNRDQAQAMKEQGLCGDGNMKPLNEKLSIQNTFTEKSGVDNGKFLKAYTTLEEHANNGTPYYGSRAISPETMEYIDDNFDKQTPDVQEAYTDIMDRPDSFGIEVEDNNQIEQLVGQGKHDFSTLEA